MSFAIRLGPRRVLHKTAAIRIGEDSFDHLHEFLIQEGFAFEERP